MHEGEKVMDTDHFDSVGGTINQYLNTLIIIAFMLNEEKHDQFYAFIHMKSFIENELKTMTIHLIFKAISLPFYLFFPSTQARHTTRVTNPSRLVINTLSVHLSFSCEFMNFLLWYLLF